MTLGPIQVLGQPPQFAVFRLDALRRHVRDKRVNPLRTILHSGAAHRFEISEQIYEHLESLLSEGLDGAELCKAWLPPPMLSDPPAHVSVRGHLSDGTEIEVDFDCEPESPPRVARRLGTAWSPDAAAD